MSEIDERIVKLSMDNRSLERNAKTSIETLKKLDDALKFNGAKDSLSNLESTINQVDFSVLTNNVDQINKRFSAFGIASATVISNITNRITDFGIRMLNSINPVAKAIGVINAGLNQIKTGGWGRATKIDQAKFKIEGLGDAWADVEKQINFGVSGTAYGLDQAANAAAQLIASGVSYDKALAKVDNITKENADDLSKSLLAISGTAAMTSADFDLIADVFIDAAAAGKVSADTFNRISAQGLNAKSTLGEKLKKTQAEIDEMSRKGQISFKEFADAMYEAYGGQAKKSNETLEGALANMKSALGRIGAEFATPLRVFWRDIYNSTRLRIDDLKAILKNAGVFETFTNLIEKTGKVVTRLIDSAPVDIFKGIADGANLALNALSGLVDMIDKFTSFLPKSAKEQEKSTEAIVEATEEAVLSEEELLEMANRVIRGEFGNGEDVRRSALGKNFEIIQNKVNELLGCTFRYDVAASNLNDTTKELSETTEGSAAATSEYANAQSALDKAVSQAQGKFNDFNSTIRKASIMLRFKKIIGGVASAFDILKTTGAAVINGAIDPIVNIVGAIGDAFLNAGAAIGDWISNLKQTLISTGFYEKLQLNINKLLVKFQGFLAKVGKVGRISFELITNTAGKVRTAFDEAKNRLEAFWTAFKETEGYNRLSTAFTNLKDQILTIKDEALAALEKKLEEFMGKDIEFPKFDADTFAESVSEKLIWLLDKISEIKNAILDFFGVNDDVGTRSTIGSSIAALISDGGTGENVGSVASIFESAKQAIYDFLSQFTESRITNFSEFVELIKDFASAVGDAVGSAFSNGVEGINGFITGLLDNPPKVGGILTLITNLLRFITKIKGTLALWGVLESIHGVGSAMENIANILGNVNRVVRRFWGVLRGVKRYFFSLARENNADALFTVTKAIIVFAGAMYLLGNLTWDQFYVAAAAIGVITAALWILLTALSKFSVRGPINPLQALSNVLLGYQKAVKNFLTDIGRASTIAALALAVAMIGNVFMKLINLPWSDAKTVLKILGALLAELAVTVFFLNRISGKGSIANAFTIVALAYTIKTIVNALAELSTANHSDLEAAAKVVLAIGGAIAVILLVMRSKAGPNGVSGLNSSIKNVLVIAAIAGVIWVAAEALTKLSTIPAEDLNQAIIAVVAVIGSLALLLFSSRNMFKGNSIGSTLVNFIAMGGLIAAIFAVLSEMQDFKPAELTAAVDAITNILKGISLLMFVMLKFGNNNIAGGAAASLKGIGSNILAVAIIAAVIAAIVALATWLESVAPTLDEFIKQGIPLIEALGEAVGSLLGSIIGGFVDGVIDPFREDLKEFGEGFTLSSIADSISEFVEKMKAMLNDTEIGDTSGIDKIIDLIWKIASASFATAIASALGNLIGEKGLLKISDNLPKFARAMVRYSWIISTMNVEAVESTNNAVSIILALADAVPNEGGFLGKLMGENDPAVFGDKLVPFASGLVKYSAIIKLLNDEAVLRTKDAVNIILELAKNIPNEGGILAEYIYGDNDPAVFGLKLIPFAWGLTRYSWVISTMNDEAVMRTKWAVEVILALCTKIPTERGLYGAIMGENDPAIFGNTLAPFASGLVKYSKIIKLLDDEAVSRTQYAVNTILALCTKIPTEGGVYNWLMGENDPDWFGLKLPPFASGLVKYGAIIKLLNDDAVMRSETAVKTILALATDIPDSGGVLGFILGDNDMETFGSQLEAFARSVVIYAGMVSEADFDKATKITKVVRGIIGLASQIYAWQESGRYSFDEFPTQMADLLGGLFEYIAGQYEKYEGGDLFGDFGKSIYERIAEGFQNAAKEGNAAGSEASIVDKIFGTGINTNISNKAVEVAEAFMATLGATIIESKDGDNGVVVKVKALFTDDIVPACTGAITESSGQFTDAVETIIDAMKLKMSSYRWTLTETMASILNSVVRIARTFNTDFVNVGKYLIDGLITGLKDPDKSTALSQTVRQIGEGMVRNMKESTQVNSPSKATMEIGRFLMEGLRIGIVDNVTPVDRAATLSAASIVRTMSDSVTTEADNTKQQLFNSLVGLYSLVNMAINEAVDTQPTITPVMDLSMIQNGVNGINGMLGRGYSFGANSLAYARNMFPGTTAYNAQTAAQMGTQSAIQGIREDIRYLGETIGNMQMVLDSGTLVGSISGGMDKQLGGMQRMKERWA